MTTIADVAAHAGVSIATVSRVLNQTARSTPATRERVLRAASDLDYHVNQPARNLRRQKTGVILILTPNMTNPFYAAILTGIGDTVNRLGYSAFIVNTGDDPDRSAEALDRLRRRQADGAILLSIDVEATWLTQDAARFPIVQCAEYQPALPLAHVSIDNYAAARDVMTYLLELGHEAIAHISAANAYQSTGARLAGYRDAIAAAGLPGLPAYIERASADYSFASGKQAALTLLTLPQPPTALFCISDTLALGAVVAAQELGLRVPEDLSVIGFDNVTETEMIRPYITTMAQPCYELGCTSSLMLDDLINRRPTERDRVLEHNLVIRESSTAPHPT